MAEKPQCTSCVSFLRAGVPGTHSHRLLFTWVLEFEFVCSCLHSKYSYLLALLVLLKCQQGDSHQPFSLVRESRPASFVLSWLVTANKGADTQNFKYRLAKEEVKMVGCPWGCPQSTLCDQWLQRYSTTFGAHVDSLQEWKLHHRERQVGARSSPCFRHPNIDSP